MSPITVVCSRCSTEYHVADAKAGKHGRCPRCGAMLHVPMPKAEPAHPAAAYGVPMSRRERRLLFWIPVGVLVLGAGAYLGHSYMAARALEREQMIQKSPQAEAVHRAQAELKSLNSLNNRLEEYRATAAEEKRLRARQIRQRDYAREPVTPYEYRLRNEVMEARAQFERENPAVAQSEDWKLNEPLTPDETERLTALASQMGGEAAAIGELLQHVKIDANLTTDALGRAFIDGEAAAKKLEALQKEAVAQVEEARRAYRAIGGKD